MKYILHYCFFIIIIVAFAYFNSMHNVEHFTPKIRAMYRPYFRSARITGENFYNKQKNAISNLFRKFGIM